MPAQVQYSIRRPQQNVSPGNYSTAATCLPVSAEENTGKLSSVLDMSNVSLWQGGSFVYYLLATLDSRNKARSKFRLKLSRC